MSQVIKAITATKGERVRMVEKYPLFNDVFSVREDIQETHSIECETQYRIGVTLGSQAWVSELDKLKSDNAVSHAVNRCKRQVIEAIFGEFRVPFRAIERALYDRDVETARKLLQKFEQQMFEVEQ